MSSAGTAPVSDREAQPHPPGKRGRRQRLGPSWRRFGTTALTWYAIVVIFGAAYGITRLARPQASLSTAMIVGALAAGPLALAFVWERLTGLRLFGVQVTLSQVTVPVDQTLATVLSEQQYFSGEDAIFRLVDRVIENPEIELLEINLRSPASPYWRSTRLYLQAALIEDRTKIQRLVFVEGDAQRRYVGMASPGQVKRALAQPPGLNLELAYRQIEHNVRQAPGPDGHSEVRRIVESWSAHTFDKDGKPLNEAEAKTRVPAELLTQWVNLEREAVEWDQPLDSALHLRLANPVPRNPGRLPGGSAADARCRASVPRLPARPRNRPL
jgi:hypothetical protein